VKHLPACKDIDHLVLKTSWIQILKHAKNYRYKDTSAHKDPTLNQSEDFKEAIFQLLKTIDVFKVQMDWKMAFKTFWKELTAETIASHSKQFNSTKVDTMKMGGSATGSERHVVLQSYSQIRPRGV
jgi:hypothetical protein